MPQNNLPTGVIEEEKVQPDFPIQEGKKHEIAQRVFRRFDQMAKNRNRTFSYFRNRTLLEYVNDNNERFNNYRRKPDWKEEWQANISDISTHSKLMAIIAQVLVNRKIIRVFPRFNRDIFSEIKATILDNLYKYTETVERNGQIDDLFALLRAARDGTVIVFEGYKKTKLEEGIDVQFVPLDQFYPGDIRKFRMEDQLECAWRTVLPVLDFKNAFSRGNWIDVDKVQPAGRLRKDSSLYFDVSEDLMEDEVEIIRYYNRYDDEYYVVANGVLINEPGSKLSDRVKGNHLPFAKGVYEPYDDKFFYGRALPDVIKDNQDSIDFLFNAMFDKELLSVMRPILVGGSNDLTEDFWYPGSIKNVMDVNQVKELGFEGPDINAFRVLKELQDRQNFVAVDPTQQGVSVGRRTATEVERAQEAAKRIYSLFNTLMNDFRLRRGRLRLANIQKFYLKNDKFKPFIVEGARLLTGKIGTQIINITSKLPVKDIYGYSPELEAQNALINHESEIIKIDSRELADFEVEMRLSLEAESDLSEALKKAFTREFAQVALSRPDLYDQPSVAKKFAEAMNQDPDEVLSKQLNQPAMPGQLPGSELANELLPTNQAAVPSLKSLITNPIQTS